MAPNKQILDTVDDFAIILTYIPFKCKLSSNKWEDIHLHSLPTNYAMLMMNIDYPDKSKDNPNGSLFMLPSKEILLDTASDIGQLYFGGELDWYGIFNFNPDKKLKESLLDLYNNTNNDMVRYLLEIAGGVMTDDIDNGILGPEIKLETAKRKALNTAESFNGSPISAIDNYIASSIPIIELLVKAVAGSDISGLKEITKTILQFNLLNADNIKKYLDKNNEILKLLKESENERLENLISDNMLIFSIILKALRLIGENIIKCLDKDKFNELVDKLKVKDAYKIWKTYKSDFFELLAYNSNLIANEKELSNIYNKNYIKTKNDEDDILSDSINYSYINSLNEDENNVNSDALDKLEEFEFDKIYDDVKHTISQIISLVIISKPEDWQIILNAKTRMEKLKEACDKEINAKIEIICRTVLNGSSSIGEKFKAAISKHPMRAEGLKRIWANYSDDLTDRIESRIRSITGNNGNSNMFVPVKQFLTVTYPSIIAMMVTWKCAFMLYKEYTNKFPITNVVIDKEKISDMEIQLAASNIEDFRNSLQNNNQLQAAQN